MKKPNFIRNAVIKINSIRVMSRKDSKETLIVNGKCPEFNYFEIETLSTEKFPNYSYVLKKLNELFNSLSNPFDVIEFDYDYV